MNKPLDEILQQNIILSVHITEEQCIFCLFQFDKNQQIKIDFIYASKEEQVGKQINQQIEELNPDKTIIGYSSGILGIELQCPILTKQLLKQSIHFQLEDAYPFEKKELQYAYYILGEEKNELKVRGFVTEKSVYNNFINQLQGLENAVDMVTTVEVAGNRVLESLNFYPQSREGNFSFTIPSAEDIPESWLDKLPKDIENEQVGSLILAFYASSSYFEKDVKNWFPLPKKLTKKLSIYKSLLIANFSFLSLLFIISIFNGVKKNYSFWKENEIFLQKKIEDINSLQKLMDSKEVEKGQAKEIFSIIKKNQNLSKGSVLSRLTKLLPVDYFITSLSINGNDVRCKVSTKSASTMKPQFYKAFVNEKQFSNLQINDDRKGVYSLNFSIEEKEAKDEK